MLSVLELMDEQKTFEEPTTTLDVLPMVVVVAFVVADVAAAFEPKVLLNCEVGCMIGFDLIVAPVLANCCCCWSYLKTLLDDVVDVVDDGVGDAVEPVSLMVLPRFLFAKSYISPKMPANVLRKFFIVSSVSSTTDD